VVKFGFVAIGVLNVTTGPSHGDFPGRGRAQRLGPWPAVGGARGVCAVDGELRDV